MEPAFSVEQALVRVLEQLEAIATVLEKCATNNTTYQPVASKITTIISEIAEEESKLYESSNENISREPLQIKFYKHIVQKIDALLQDSLWQSTSFLSNLSQSLAPFLAELKQAIDVEDPTVIKPKLATELADDSSLYTNVYVSLYCVSGELHDWEKILNNIGQQVISRPILTQEEHIKTFIRAKPNPKNQAYAVLRVLESNIIRKMTADRPDHDSLGHEMVSIKDSRIDTETIQYFVHENQVYTLEHGLLVRKNNFE